MAETVIDALEMIDVGDGECSVKSSGSCHVTDFMIVSFVLGRPYYYRKLSSPLGPPNSTACRENMKTDRS
jgi:hypothetical protein